MWRSTRMEDRLDAEPVVRRWPWVWTTCDLCNVEVRFEWVWSLPVPAAVPGVSQDGGRVMRLPSPDVRIGIPRATVCCRCAWDEATLMHLRRDVWGACDATTAFVLRVLRTPGHDRRHPYAIAPSRPT